MNKFISVVLFVIGFLFIAGALGSCMLRSSVGLEPEIGANLFMIALGILSIWGGSRLWKR
jgi:ABC-type antimicrobial peptide transport system permease subunit